MGELSFSPMSALLHDYFPGEQNSLVEDKSCFLTRNNCSTEGFDTSQDVTSEPPHWEVMISSQMFPCEKALDL